MLLTSSFLFARSPNCHLLRRCISTTIVYFKQPPHDRQRYRRHKQPPYQSLQFFDEAPLEYLPKKPPVVEVQWGSIDPKVKNLRYKQSEQLKSAPSLFTKLQELYHLENNLWFHSLDLPLAYPGMLDFVKFLTRTKVLAYQPKICQQPIMSAYCNQALIELATSNFLPLNSHDISAKAMQSRATRRCRQLSTLMEAIYRAFVHSEPDLHNTGLFTQIDERATIETFIKRLVDPDLFENNDDNIAEDIYEPVNETILDAENCIRFRIRSELAWQLRGPYPLKALVEMNNPVCFEKEALDCKYRPEAFGLSTVDCYNFSCLPYALVGSHTEFARSVAGYWTSTPFWTGDPCEFGLVGVLDACRAEKVYREIHSTNLDDQTKCHILTNHNVTEALITAFAWTSAQAYNQGFTLYNELTYPFCTQILIFDQTHVQLLQFQLNSLTSLWKPDDAQLPYNLAWISERIPLLESHILNGYENVHQVTTEAMSLMSSTFFYPMDTTSNLDSTSMRPYISSSSSTVEDRIWCPLIPKSEEHVLISSAMAGQSDEPLDGSGLTEPERIALDAVEAKDRKQYPLRLYTAGRPHPNDVFFFKITEKESLIEEIKETMPDFGGPFSQLPEPYNSLVNEYRIFKRNRQRRVKVEAPPRRWR